MFVKFIEFRSFQELYELYKLSNRYIFEFKKMFFSFCFLVKVDLMERQLALKHLKSGQ